MGQSRPGLVDFSGPGLGSPLAQSTRAGASPDPTYFFPSLSTKVKYMKYVHTSVFTLDTNNI